eukprot:6831019-Prymnesium_polylepis.1
MADIFSFLMVSNLARMADMGRTYALVRDVRVLGCGCCGLRETAFNKVKLSWQTWAWTQKLHKTRRSGSGQ